MEFLKKILQCGMLNCGIILYSEMQKSELLCEVRYERAKIRYKENYFCGIGGDIGDFGAVYFGRTRKRRSKGNYGGI